MPGGRNDYPTRDGWTASYTGQLGPDYAEKHRRMGPGDRFCRSDNAPQDGDSAEVAERPIVATTQYPMPDLTFPPPPVFAISNPAMEAEEDDPDWSTLETSGSQFTT